VEVGGSWFEVNPDKVRMRPFWKTILTRKKEKRD
jgi:hypothetical protein